jgi:hypothetical protein
MIMPSMGARGTATVDGAVGRAIYHASLADLTDLIFNANWSRLLGGILNARLFAGIGIALVSAGF